MSFTIISTILQRYARESWRAQRVTFASRGRGSAGDNLVGIMLRRKDMDTKSCLFGVRSFNRQIIKNCLFDKLHEPVFDEFVIKFGYHSYSSCMVGCMEV